MREEIKRRVLFWSDDELKRIIESDSGSYEEDEIAFIKSELVRRSALAADAKEEPDFAGSADSKEKPAFAGAAGALMNELTHYRTFFGNIPDEHIKKIIMFRNYKNINTIKNIMVFFLISSILSLIGGIIFFIGMGCR